MKEDSPLFLYLDLLLITKKEEVWLMIGTHLSLI